MEEVTMKKKEGKRQRKPSLRSPLRGGQRENGLQVTDQFLSLSRFYFRLIEVKAVVFSVLARLLMEINVDLQYVRYCPIGKKINFSEMEIGILAAPAHQRHSVH